MQNPSELPIWPKLSTKALCAAARWTHGSTSAIRGSPVPAGQSAHGTREGSVSRRWALQTLHQGGRARQQAEWSWKNGPKCVAREPRVYLRLRVGINWETRWWLLGRKGKKHVVSTGPREAGWGLAGASSAGGASVVLVDLGCARRSCSFTAAGRHSLPGSRQGAGKGRSAMVPRQLGGTGGACMDKGVCHGHAAL